MVSAVVLRPLIVTLFVKLFLLIAAAPPIDPFTVVLPPITAEMPAAPAKLPIHLSVRASTASVEAFTVKTPSFSRPLLSIVTVLPRLKSFQAKLPAAARLREFFELDA